MISIANILMTNIRLDQNKPSFLHKTNYQWSKNSIMRLSSVKNGYEIDAIYHECPPFLTEFLPMQWKPIAAYVTQQENIGCEIFL